MKGQMANKIDLANKAWELDDILKRCDKFEERLKTIEEKPDFLCRNTEASNEQIELCEVGISFRQYNGCSSNYRARY